VYYYQAGIRDQGSKQMPATVFVNGRITDEREAVVSVFDHGFLYGEGVYETLRTYNHRLFLFDRHARRLRRSAQMIALDLPFTDDDLLDAISQTIRRAGLAEEAYVRVLVTRGVGELTYDPKATPTHSLVIIVKPQVDPPAAAYHEGVGVAIVDIVRNHPGSVNPKIKSNNLMNNALAMQEALRRGAFEGVMRNYRGELTECTTANLFIVKDGVVLTPPLDAGLLPGITREFIFEIGEANGISVREAALRDDDLLGADEAFLTSTTREAVPIVTVDDRVIGPGTPGPVTLRLLAEFRRAARSL
jgi:branched-chain amino acid aminotransferase